MSLHGFVTDQSRKARAIRNVYDYLRARVKTGDLDATVQWDVYQGHDGIRVPKSDKYRVLNIRFHEEHLSPYFKTDMNLFHMLMMDDSAEITIYKADRGWLLVFEGIPETPKPFGQNGFDTR